MLDVCIKNLRNEKPKNPWDIIVDRRSPLGNPFFMYNESQRDEVCDKYKVWFEDVIKNMEDDYPLQRNELKRLIEIYYEHEQINLFCWCSPKRCHAETIKEYLESEMDGIYISQIHRGMV